MKRGLVLVGSIAIIGVVLGISALYVSWKGAAASINSIAAGSFEDSSTEFSTEELATEPAEPSGESVADFSDNAPSSPEQLNQAQIDEVREWKVRHGYADFYRDFGRLSEHDLLSLAESGEIGALHILASRNIHKHPDKAIDYYREAAVHGSTYALILVGELYMFHATDDGLIDELKTKEQGARQALAYNFAAQMLGDNAVSPIQSARLINTVLGESMLNESVSGEICSKAHSILSEIQRIRTSNGYRPYEQSIAPYSDPVDPSVSAATFCGAESNS